MTSPYRVGPLRLVKRGGTFFVHGTLEGRRIRVATGSSDLVVARNALDNMHAEHNSGWRLKTNCDDAVTRTSEQLNAEENCRITDTEKRVIQ